LHVIAGTMNDLCSAIRLVAGARAPLVLVGTAARPAMHLVAAIASLRGAAVLTTPDALSIYSSAGGRAHGVCSFGGTPRARAIAAASDVVIVIGTNVGEFAGRGGQAFGNAKVVQITDDPSDLCIARPATVTLVGNVSTILASLADALPCDAPPTPWFDSLPSLPAPPPRATRSGRGIDPKDAMLAIGEGMPLEARIACDITTAALVLVHDLPLHPKTSVWLQIERSAVLGTALAAGLGIRVASGVPTLALLGDWGLMIGAAELHTVATQSPSRFVIVAWANEGGAMVRNGVHHQGLDVPSALHTWTCPDFAQIAQGFGLRAVTVNTAGALRDAVREGMGASSPLLVHAVIDPDGEIPGAADRYRALSHSGGTE
jgi:thiamine pyrophosphate-dependent acetolactate synthase large subunit-like protein